mgnify:FL=1
METMERLDRYLLRYDGKDKLGRVIQYVLKGSSYYLSTKCTGEMKELGLRLHGAYKQISVTRKTFRLGRWINNGMTAKSILERKLGLDDVLNIMANFSMAMWALLDNVIWAFSVKVIVVSKPMQLYIRTRQRQFRIFTALCKLIVAIRTTQRAAHKGAREKVNKGMLNCAKNVLDVFSYAKGSHAEWLVFNIDCHNGVSGIAGTFASLIAIYKIWTTKTLAK